MDYVSIEEARELGKWASANVFNELVQFLFQENTLTSIISTLALLDKYAGAFALEQSYSNGSHTLILLHKMGLKWSAFYEELAVSMLHQLGGQLKSVSVSGTENQVVIAIEAG